ncbi:hypothetical protein G647_03791 [Cladophialophora carrionii CBS 160.54]|uniref:Uncharacterized protein n=1 Tax=Cladophialophora carrionii CBS 160.54 TaxID=1279043 RepID=V9DEQ7_9EURO|nr:uncharacterized protein G647_03791 [Cladophialophora carrionii CBS 160.54]ETI24422.1 hypothetical protein G647_03791 [Cladophialophora carrionii CBS 160.54]
MAGTVQKVVLLGISRKAIIAELAAACLVVTAALRTMSIKFPDPSILPAVVDYRSQSSH